jgi:hypothetical protein
MQTFIQAHFSRNLVVQRANGMRLSCAATPRRLTSPEYADAGEGTN